MDGASLLTEVMKRHPNTIRFVLSGQSDKETILRSIGPTHQFLAKPCDSETLKNAVEQALALRNLMSSVRLKQLVSQLVTLTQPPYTLSKNHERTSLG